MIVEGVKRELITFLIATFALVGRAADKSAAAKPDSYPQDGVWKPVSAVLRGSKLPKAAVNAISLRISGANYHVSVTGEKVPDQGTHALVESTMPKRIIITSTNGPNKGSTFLGIYEVTDTNSFRVCYDLTGNEFPAKFESTAKTGYYLVEYRRNEAKAPPRATNAAEDAKRQNGVWKAAGGIRAGERLTREQLNKVTLAIKDGTCEMVGDAEPHADKGTISLDTSTPKRMSIHAVEGPNKGKTILAIYEMGQTEGGDDTLRVCYDLSGKAFPTEFNSPKGSTRYLVGYRRQKERK